MSRARGGLRTQLLRGATGSVVVAMSAKVIMLASAVILARMLGPSGYGLFSFAVSVAALLTFPAELGMSQLLMREIAAAEAVGRWDLVGGVLRRAAQLGTLATCLVLTLSLSYIWLLRSGMSADLRLTLTAAMGLMVANAWGSLAAASLMGLRRVVAAQIPMQVGRPALLLLGVVSIWALCRKGLDPLTAMCANVAAAVLMVGALFVLSARNIGRRTTRVAPCFETRRWLTSALPFALMGGVGLINAQTDIVMLGAMRTQHDVGIYRVAVAGASMIPLVLGAINAAIGPTLAHAHTKGDRQRLIGIVRATALVGLAGGLFGFAVFGLWGEEFIRVIFGSAYLTAWMPLMILALGQTVNAGAGPVGVVLNMTGHERDTFGVLALSAALNVGLNAALIPRFGTLGAASATAISTVMWNVLMTWRVKRRLSFLPLGLLCVPRLGI